MSGGSRRGTGPSPPCGSSFNVCLTGRKDAASTLPPDCVPPRARLAQSALKAVWALRWSKRLSTLSQWGSRCGAVRTSLDCNSGRHGPSFDVVHSEASVPHLFPRYSVRRPASGVVVLHWMYETQDRSPAT
jgi:hypothetical protein